MRTRNVPLALPRATIREAGSACAECGAWRGELGLEPTPDLFVEHLVDVFREVRRVLRPDGVCWVNLGDSYVGAARGSPSPGTSTLTNPMRHLEVCGAPRDKRAPGLKPKDMVLIPFRFALAAQADGWWVRSDCIWAKPNPMPESVTDRPTKSHEYVFMLTKSASYYYDAEAVKEPASGTAHARGKGTHPKSQPAGSGVKANTSFSAAVRELVQSRNLRTVRVVATRPFKDAHFATYPPELIEPFILASTSQKGACPTCGAPWQRVIERKAYGGWFEHDHDMERGTSQPTTGNKLEGWSYREYVPPRTVGWEQTCECAPADPVPCVVLDPFNGSGTTGVVALQHGRRYIGIELKPEYAAMARRRILDEAPATTAAHALAARAARTEQATLFGGAPA